MIDASILVIGAGAIGGVTAAKMKGGVRRVTVLDSDEEHVARMRDPGLLLDDLGEEAGPFLRVAFRFPDHERRPRGLCQMAGSKVRSPPLHRPHDEVLVSDDRGYAVLHEPVA